MKPLHFLEDMYAACHVACSWGDVSQRKGTYDFYNQNGLEVFTWKGRERTIVLMSDAHMRPEDAELTAKAVRTSLEQVLDTETGRSRGYDVPYVPMAPSSPDPMDICKSATRPKRAEDLEYKGRYTTALGKSLSNTPVPGLGAGLGSQPRARSEVGPFVGLAGSIAARGVNGGFERRRTRTASSSGSIEGALGDAGDGLVFAQLGFAADSSSTNNFSETGVGAALTGSLGAAIPARTGLSARVRMPFYLIPGDPPVPRADVLF